MWSERLVKNLVPIHLKPSFRLNQSRRGGRPWFCVATASSLVDAAFS